MVSANNGKGRLNTATAINSLLFSIFIVRVKLMLKKPAKPYGNMNFAGAFLDVN